METHKVSKPGELLSLVPLAPETRVVSYYTPKHQVPYLCSSEADKATNQIGLQCVHGCLNNPN